jgi:hypothetical protein
MFLHGAFAEIRRMPLEPRAAKLKVLQYVLPRRAVARRLLCGVAADRHSPALKCTALLLMSGEPWWTQIWWKSYSQLCSVHSVWIYLMRLLLHYIIALQFDHQIGEDLGLIFPVATSQRVASTWGAVFLSWCFSCHVLCRGCLTIPHLKCWTVFVCHSWGVIFVPVFQLSGRFLPRCHELSLELD